MKAKKQKDPDVLSSLINLDHVSKQFSRRGNLSSAQFLYGEIAKRMSNQLKYMRIHPFVVLDAGCGYANGFFILKKLYPKATKYIGLDNCENILNLAKKRFLGFNFKSLMCNIVNRRLLHFLNSDLSKTSLNPEDIDLIWSNLALHWHPNPQLVFSEWRRILKINGLAIFSSFGFSTLKELREAVICAKLSTKSITFSDIHELGDSLIKAGLINPVLTREIITLTYESPKKLVKDMHILGGNPVKNRRKGLAGSSWINCLYTSLEKQRNKFGLIPITIEIIYGHAWKGNSYSSSDGLTKISINSLKNPI